MREVVPDRHLDRKDKIGFATPESTWLSNKTVEIEKLINQSPELPFINKVKLLEEFFQIKTGQRAFDGRVWRWFNYLRWCTLMNIK